MVAFAVDKNSHCPCNFPDSISCVWFFKIGISKDGDFDLPDGLILNPKVREHWLLIEKTLGMGDYDDAEDESAGDGPEKLVSHC